MESTKSAGTTWVLYYGGLTNKGLCLLLAMWLFVIGWPDLPDAYHNSKPLTFYAILTFWNQIKFWS